MRRIRLSYIGAMLVCGAALAGVNDGLVAYYPFNGNANDESGNGYDGTAYGANLTEDMLGNPDSAYSFDGIASYIDTTPSTDMPSTITFAAWLRPIPYAGLASVAQIGNIRCGRRLHQQTARHWAEKETDG